MGLFSLVKHPLTKDIQDLDSEENYSIHRQIILSKPLLYKIYQDFYRKLLRPFDYQKNKNLRIIEIGAGGFNANYFYPDIITTDLDKTPYVKESQNAHALTYGDHSLDGIILVDVLHHIPEPEKFFGEISRCLKIGGKAVIIEPYFSAWGNFVYKKLHHEPWSDSDSWKLENCSGRLTGTNTRMPYNIFIRDRKKFERLYPELKIEKIDKFNYFCYLLSGGLSYISLVPKFLAATALASEKLLKFLDRQLALHMTIEITRTNSPSNFVH